jgi:hypothetical protein
MQARFIVLLAVLTVIAGLSRAQAQGPTPQTYSLTEDPGIPLAGPEVVKISRDGSKEVIEQIMPPIPGQRYKEYHGHLLYDFQAHRLYTQVLSDPGVPCGVQEFNDAAAPAELDVISGAADIQKELTGKGQVKQVGTETVNGFATNVMEFTSPDASGKIWVAQKGGFPIKLVFIDKAGKATTFIEVTQLSFAKPPASLFAVPASCASAQLPPPPAPPAKPGPNVTAVTLQPTSNYTGPCPAHIKLVGTITVDAPGTVYYEFGAGKVEPGETTAFSAAGTKTVTHVITFPPPAPGHGNQIGVYPGLTAIGVDGNGNHGIPTKGANNSGFNIICTSGGGK